MTRTNPRFRPVARTEGAGDPNGHAVARAPDFLPCWRCHWFHHHSPQALDMSACLNPRCSSGRSQPERGCSCWRLDPDRANDPKPTADPTPEVRIAFKRWREGLEKLFERANGSKQPWDSRRYVLNREGLVGPPEVRPGERCSCCLPVSYRG